MTRAREASTREMFPISELFIKKSSNCRKKTQAKKQNNGCIADESGFVYRPPSHHSYSTGQSTGSQSSAVDHSSCYLPSQFLAINQSLSNPQSETLTPYFAAVPLSAKRNERSALTSSCGSSSYNKCVNSTPITSPANLAIEMGRKNMLHKKWKPRQGSEGIIMGSNVLVDGSKKRKKTINYPEASKRLRKPLLESQIYYHNRREIVPVEENLFSLGGHDYLPPLSKQIQGNLCESNESIARVCQRVATLFGKDLDTKKQIYPSPATRSERRLWRNDFDNISDDDELSSHSNEDIKGQNPLFPYPGGPGFQGASFQTLSIMWRVKNKIYQALVNHVKYLRGW
ncbi:hypothetical protein PPACK8108_LOCUS13221 [Phakopsora pachyrhizi]|uniref:Uncharacterized protein n=1 Tax=Phakopsora pachyrhizi TaxID=170000 RepID=A0AAV0B2W5_PHAPC|nr:hypothetical protein PPACK8108_LOCUS13221 [Phakopsora pachyrhizi]